MADVTANMSTSDLASAVSAATSSLLNDLRAAGVADLKQAQDFANAYAPKSVKWALNLANAKLANDAHDIEVYSDLLSGIAALALADAADAAILAAAKLEDDAQQLMLSAAQAALMTLIAAI